MFVLGFICGAFIGEFIITVLGFIYLIKIVKDEEEKLENKEKREQVNDCSNCMRRF